MTTNSQHIRSGRRARQVATLLLALGCGEGDTRSFLDPKPEPDRPSLIRLSVIPRSARLLLGDSASFVAWGHFGNGDSAVVPATWRSASGTVSTSGGYHTVQEGADTVWAVATAVPSLSGAATLEVVHPLDSAVVRINPEELTLARGQSVQFEARATLPDGREVVPEFVWSSAGGTITSDGRFLANLEPGTYPVMAQIKGRRKSGTTPVNVGPASLDALVLSPASASLKTGEKRQFTVTASWSDGSTAVPDLTFTATGGTISGAGLYTAGAAPGTFRVIAASIGGGRADTSAVTISLPVPTLTAVVLSPASATLAPGAAAQFTATGTWSDGSTTAPAVTFSATGGTITPGGVYTAGSTPGTFRVIATQQAGTRGDTAIVTITAPVLLQLVLSPASLTLASGTTAQFSVTGSWSDGSTSVPAVTWSATGGTVTANGLYTSGTTAGTYRVVAKQQGGNRADTSAVTVTVPPPTLTQLVLNPGSVTLAPAATQQFTVTGSWSNGSTTVPAVTWSATGGTVTAGGLYTAGTTAGTFRVIAGHQGGTRADTSVVTVTTPAPSALVLVTQPSGAVSGAAFTQQPVVELRNAQNQPVQQSGIVVTASRATGTGTLAGPLTATTNAQGRAVFSGLRITGTGPHAVAFASPGLTTGTSASFTVAAQATLRSLATARGFQIGAAVRDSAFRDDPVYRQTLVTQYNSIVPEDATDFWPIHPDPGIYKFAAADALVDFAQANGMAFHGHHLVWYSWIPTWVTNGGFTSAQVRAILKDHITTVVGRYRGKAVSWDVANEVIDNAGCWQNKCGLQPSFWLTHLGPEYIDSAFVWARRADPAAKLYLNDYRTETINNKSDTLLALAKRLKARGVPIDGVGFQVHLFRQHMPWPTSAQVQANFQRFADAGFDIRITEMDADIADADGFAALTGQAAVYRDILNACLNVSRCKELTTWGFSDRFSWVPASFPGYGRALPFDTNYQPKPAVDSLIARLRQP